MNLQSHSRTAGLVFQALSQITSFHVFKAQLAVCGKRKESDPLVVKNVLKFTQ